MPQENSILLCKNCFNCKIKNEKVYCKLGYFSDEILEYLLYIPQDFDCQDFTGFEE